MANALTTPAEEQPEVEREQFFAALNTVASYCLQQSFIHIENSDPKTLWGRRWASCMAWMTIERAKDDRAQAEATESEAGNG